MTKDKYDIIFVTNIPSFYKLKLYNELNKYRKILVIFTEQSDSSRNADFFRGKFNFDYIDISKCSTFGKFIETIKILFSKKFNTAIICGWNIPTFWFFALLNPRRKNAVAVESSIFESQINGGIKSFFKRIFISRMSIVYASGMPHQRLVEALGFKGKVILTKGVGLFNTVEQPKFLEKKEVVKFLYVGRLVQVKNLKFLIRVFNNFPNLILNIAGFGIDEPELKAIANKNINFLGAINNADLPQIYQANDVFVLPSISEPWGLVVEEALNNGIPVLYSNKIGCKEDVLCEGENGIEFNCDDESTLASAIIKICDIKTYNKLRFNVSKMDFQQRQQKQIESYL